MDERLVKFKPWREWRERFERDPDALQEAFAAWRDRVDKLMPVMLNDRPERWPVVSAMLTRDFADLTHLLAGWCDLKGINPEPLTEVLRLVQLIRNAADTHFGEECTDALMEAFDRSRYIANRAIIQSVWASTNGGGGRPDNAEDRIDTGPHEPITLRQAAMLVKRSVGRLGDTLRAESDAPAPAKASVGTAHVWEYAQLAPWLRKTYSAAYIPDKYADALEIFRNQNGG